MMSDQAFNTILAVARRVRANPDERDVLSTGEQLAVALVLNRPEWLAESKYTLCEAIDRLGSDWVSRLRAVERALKMDAAG